MAIQEIVLFEYECDAPECGAQSRVASRDQLPSGWRTGTVLDDRREHEVDWIACSDFHVGDAVQVIFEASAKRFG